MRTFALFLTLLSAVPAVAFADTRQREGAGLCATSDHVTAPDEVRVPMVLGVTADAVKSEPPAPTPSRSCVAASVADVPAPGHEVAIPPPTIDAPTGPPPLTDGGSVTTVLQRHALALNQRASRQYRTGAGRFAGADC